MIASRLAIAAVLGAFAVAGCGGSSSASGPQSPSLTTAQTSPAAAHARKGPKVQAISSRYGRILADGHGRALYLFTADNGKGAGSACSGDCAVAWPPYLGKSKPSAGPGAKGALIGTASRGDGRRQVTYAGHPLYYYEGDRSPGEVNCQAAVEFGGYWYVLRSTGKAVH
jgi:predicted lipoprotein with Yx(FWY)xxD motif